MTDVLMPQLGESVSEGTIAKWLVAEGDVVKKDQPIVSIATDKADNELPSPVNGRVTKLVAAEGSVLPVNALLCQLEEGNFESAAKPAEKASGDAAPPAAAQQASSAQAAPAAPAQAAPAPAASSGNGTSRDVLAQPAVRDRARQEGVDLSNVRGTGEMGRITMDDVSRAKGAQPAPAAAGAPAAAATGKSPAAAQNLAAIVNQSGGFVPPIPGLGFGAFKVPQYRPKDGDKVIPFTRRRRITADHMTYSKFASPHVVTVAEVDLFKASQLRDAHKERYKKEGMPLTMLAFVVGVAARALRENSALNARVLDDSYVIFRDVNLGVAVDSPDGLVVPVIRRADELGVKGVVRAIDDIAKRARTGKLTADDLSGATFSITNPGLKGNLFGGAIINQPNVGILRMGEIQKRVVVIEGPSGEDLIAIHPIMYMALSYDHRVVDGVAANNFLWRVTELMEKAEFEV